MDEFRLDATILKVDSSLGLVMGWGIICSEDAGVTPYFDRQNEHVPELAMLTESADFMANRRVAKDMHSGEEQGQVVFAFPMTVEIAKSFGITTPKTGLMIAVRPNPGMMAKFESGEFTGFSIGGSRIESEDAETGEVIRYAKYSDSQERSSNGQFGGGGSNPADVHRMKAEHDQNTKRLTEIKSSREASRMQHETRRLESRNAELKSLMSRVRVNQIGKGAADQARDDHGRFTAGQLNEHLKSGGVVQVTTHMHSTLYGEKHAGHFSEKNGNLHVKAGKGTNQLSQGGRMLVGIRTGRFVNKSVDDPDEILVEKYSPAQSRHDSGKFTQGGGPDGYSGQASLREQKLYTQAHGNLNDLRNSMMEEKDPAALRDMQGRAANIQSFIRHQLETRPGIEGHMNSVAKGLGDDDESAGIKPSDMLDLESVGTPETSKRPKNKMKGSAKNPAPVDNSTPASS